MKKLNIKSEFINVELGSTSEVFQILTLNWSGGD